MRLTGVPISKELLETTGRNVALRSVYAALDRLEQKQLVSSTSRKGRVFSVGRAVPDSGEDYMAELGRTSAMACRDRDQNSPGFLPVLTWRLRVGHAFGWRSLLKVFSISAAAGDLLTLWLCGSHSTISGSNARWLAIL